MGDRAGGKKNGPGALQAEDSHVLNPGADLVGILPSHDPRDLKDMIEVVGGPGRKELAKSHRPELGMSAFLVQILVAQLPGLQRRQILLPQLLELIKQIA